mgnify:CR=1 FL=1
MSKKNKFLLKKELYNKKYFVEDLIDNKTKVLLVLDSPSEFKITYKNPLSGSSGKTISEKLFGLKDSIRKLKNDNNSKI